MPQGISIHIGLNIVDPQHYGDTGFDTSLNSCNKDANDMAEIAKSCNFNTPIFDKPSPVPQGDIPNLVLLDKEATTGAVIASLKESANKLKAGDILLITYAGHGGQIVDVSGNEGDGFDETWCLHDRQFLDEEFFELLTEFKEGVRIVVISDSCNNGTVIGARQIGLTDTQKTLALMREVDFVNTQDAVLNLIGFKSIKYNTVTWTKDYATLTDLGRETSKFQEVKLDEPKPRTIPRSVLSEVRRAFNDEFGNNRYDQIQREVKNRLLEKQEKRGKKDIQDLVDASVILISACEDWQFTSDGVDGNSNGLFTKTLKDVWSKEKFSNYLQFHEKIWNKLKATQSPNYYRIGSPNTKFELSKPFTI